MYGRQITTASLPFTGAFLGISWTILAAATLIGVGLALLRLIPREEE
jgi:hypothetical protein